MALENSGKPWTKGDLDTLIFMGSEGYRLDYIAEKLGRSELAIQLRLERIETDNLAAFTAQYYNEPTEEKPMTQQLNFDKPVENLTRVFGVESVESLNDEELISMIRNARKYVKGLEDMVEVSSKIKAKCAAIEVGIRALVKALDKETGE